MKQNKLRDKIRQLIEKFGSSTKDLYEQFEEVKEELPDLKEDTFKRTVRKEVNGSLKQKQDLINNLNERFYLSTTPLKLAPIYDIPFKRILVSSDWHCGHQAGLCTPSWFQRTENPHFEMYARIQNDLWSFFSETITKLKEQHPIDHMILNADIIDGNQTITKGAEAITTERRLQCEIAKEIIEFIDVQDKIFFTVGSAYHTGKSEDWEAVLAEQVGANIQDEHYIDISGKLFHVKHDIAQTSVPYGKITPIVKQSVLEDLKSVKYGDRFVDIVIRSHVHFFADFRLGEKRGIITPSFQFTSKFGRRKCDGPIDVGFVIIDIYENGHVEINPYLAVVKERTRKIIYC